MHAGNAGEAILRLENLGLQRKLFCPVIRAVVCQELDLTRKRSQLYADIAEPKDSFASMCMRAESEDDFDLIFMHYTNYPEVLQERMRELSERQTVEKNIRRIPYFKGGKNAKRIHGSAV